MSDILSALSSAGVQDTSNMSQLDMLVMSYRNTKQPQVNALKTKQQTLEQRQIFFNQLNSKLNTLLGKIDAFGELSVTGYNMSFEKSSSADEKFVTRNISASDTNVLTASATSSAVIGIGSVKVDRLATNDVLISDRLSLSGDFALTGSHIFNIMGKDVTVEFGTETVSNEDAIKKIASAINNTEDIGISTAIVKDTSTTGQLTFTAIETGTTREVDDEIVSNDIRFIDGSEVLDALGLTSSLNSGTSSRQTFNASQSDKAYYKIDDINKLNSQVEINGVFVSRSTNTISDALQGVTLSLKKPQESDDPNVTLTTTVGTNAVRNLIKPILDTFNDLLDFLGQDKTLLRADPSVSSLKQSLRGLPSNGISSVQNPANSDDIVPRYLTEIGISIDTEGKLSISDLDKLQKILEDDPQKVANLFTSEDSFTAKLNKIIYNYTGDNGIVMARKRSLTEQIQTTSQRTKELEDRIDLQAEALRKQYQSMLEVYLEAQSQYNSLSSYSSTSYY